MKTGLKVLAQLIAFTVATGAVIVAGTLTLAYWAVRDQEVA